jgi:hypothetical protein
MLLRHLDSSYLSLFRYCEHGVETSVTVMIFWWTGTRAFISRAATIGISWAMHPHT